MTSVMGRAGVLLYVGSGSGGRAAHTLNPARGRQVPWDNAKELLPVAVILKSMSAVCRAPAKD